MRGLGAGPPATGRRSIGGEAERGLSRGRFERTPSRLSWLIRVGLFANLAGAIAAVAAGTGTRPGMTYGASGEDTIIPAGVHLSAPASALEVTPDGGGYWIAGSDGGILTHGDAGYFGSAANLHLGAPIVGMAVTPDGRGYWLAGADGGVMAYGDAGYYGSAGGVRLSAPVVGMASTPDGRGYWLAGTDGGVMAYGDAGFYGSAHGLRLGAPIVGVASAPDGRGYWLAGADGGVMAYGDAGYFGSASGLRLGAPIVGMASTPDGRGYWLAGADGGVMSFGDARFYGAAAGGPVAAPVTAIARTPDGRGYGLAESDGGVSSFGEQMGQAPTTTASDLVATGPPVSSTASGESTDSGDGFVPSPADPGYTFVYPGGPGETLARWNPCTPIRYAVNLADAGSTALADIQAAVTQVSAATGIRFEYAGQTDYVPDPKGPAGLYPPGIDVVIAWVAPADFGATTGEAGYGGSWWESSGGPRRIFEGYVLVNGSIANSMLTPGFGPGMTDGDLLLHELGHMMGLDHTYDKEAVMYPVEGLKSPGAYGRNDLTGLRILGSGGCL